ncbi:MAG: hypothetical protein LBC48_07815 [Dysgonamonadaceae bacterium]|jgi:hypothetical protein|nr:hypothetical protein [Dysgonamonadaceae bacterium]
MTNYDWLPYNHGALCNQAEQTMDYLTQPGNLARMGFGEGTPQGEWFIETFDVKYTNFLKAYKAWVNPAQRTKEKVIALTVAEKAFKQAYRQLYNGFLKDSPLVTEEDLAGMGLPQRNDGHHSRVPVPTDTIDATVALPSPGVVEIHYHSAGAEKRAKPAGVHGAELVWAIRDTPPDDWAELTHSSFDTRTPFYLSFDGEKRGKKLYFALRWENTRGEKGPWSTIFNTIIP